MRPKKVRLFSLRPTVFFNNLEIDPRSYLSLLLLCIILIPASVIEARGEMIKFEHISIKEGLSQSSVFCIMQDRAGLLWFGTENGLNRYDGYTFDTYFHDPTDPSSISDNTIYSILEDHDGIIWIGTVNGGLNTYNYTTGSFSHFRKNATNPASISSDTIHIIYEDSNHILWIGTPNGLNRLDRKSKKFIKYRHDPQNPHSLGHDHVQSIFEDSSHHLWIGTLGGGLNRYNPLRDDFTKYVHDARVSNSISHNHIHAIYEAPSEPGILWIGTWGGGLNRMDVNRKRFTAYKARAGNLNSINYNEINTIFEDSRGNLWVGTTMGGINLLDRKSGKFKIYKNHPRDQTSLSSNDVLCIHEDRSGIIWIGTTIGGLNKFDRSKNKFIHYKYNPGIPNSLSHRMVRSLLEDHAGKLWVGTADGLTCIDRDRNRYTYYRHNNSNTNSLGFSDIMVITEDSQGRLWIGTWNGLNVLSRSRKHFTRYYHNPDNPESISNNRIFSLHMGRSGIVWIGTQKGLNKYNGEKNIFKRFFHDPKNNNSLCHNFVQEIYEDRNRTLWIGTAGGGLSKLDPDKNIFTHHKNDANNPYSLSHNSVSAFCEDSRGFLWIGTAEGLNRWDAEGECFHRFGRKDNFPNTSITGILEDNDRNLWIGHFQGLLRFNPETGEIRNFNVRDGLQSNEFNRGACFKSKSGEMFFGGINGFSSFYPERIRDRNYIPPIILTAFKIFNTPVTLNKPIFEIDNIKLSYRQNFFSFEFAAVDYSTPDNNVFAYKMEGIDPDWVFCGNRRYANYVKVEPGHYLFRVMGSNNNEIWNEEGIKIKVQITPPFWQTGWFKSILIFILIASAYLALRLRTKQLKTKIAEQKKIEKILKDSRDEMQEAKELAEFRLAQIKELVSSISSILIAVDMKGIVFQWNNAAQTFFNISREDIIGHHISTKLKPYFKSAQLKDIIEKGLSSTTIREEKELYLQKDENPCILSMLINPILGSSHKKLGLLLLCEDITKKRAEEEQKKIMLKLKTIGEMQAGIIHDINTPIQEIKINSYMISDTINELLKEELFLSGTLTNSDRRSIGRNQKGIKQSILQINSAAKEIGMNLNRISTTIKALKTFFYPGKKNKENADINELLRTTLLVAQNYLKKIADISRNLSKDIPMLKCYPSELIQVFLNIIINGADSIKEKGGRGEIKISSRLVDSEIVIIVQDNGRGIPDELKNKIFQPFFTTKEIGKGTGQGLSLGKRIIEERHAGRIEFTSKIDNGTTFYIYLPL